jgi:HEAT repeat protein
LKADDPVTRKQAACALGKIGKDARGVLPQLEAALTDNDVAVRIEAVLATWLIHGDTKGIAVLVKALGDKSSNVRDFACQALAAMKADAKDAIPALTNLLQDKELRIRAVMTLGEIGFPAIKVVSELKKLLNDKDGEAQLCSAFVIWQITGQAADTLPVLEKGLESEAHDRLAIRLLGNMGGAAQRALPTLAALYRAEEVASYRQLLSVSIKKIDPKAAMQLGIR